MLKEACVETLEQCVRAQKQGADRIELCADLAQDGLTPSYELIKLAAERVDIPIRVMIRPRAGDFVYSREEIVQMKKDIDFCRSVGVEGVVFGVCTAQKTLDIEKISELARHSSPLKVTIHKAIDSCSDPVNELVLLKNMANIHAVLTSGKEATALEGSVLLRSLVTLAGDDIEVIACGKVTDKNLAEVHQRIGARAYHGKRIVGVLDDDEGISTTIL